jgi:hypothetical protein
LVGKEYAMIFSIISSGNADIKVKYYNIITEAADKGELNWSDVCYYVDKVCIAKKEPQVYGTQFKFEGKYKLFYPIKDKSDLNDRRKKVGLDVVDLSQINDTAPYKK